MPFLEKNVTNEKVGKSFKFPMDDQSQAATANLSAKFFVFGITRNMEREHIWEKKINGKLVGLVLRICHVFFSVGKVCEL